MKQRILTSLLTLALCLSLLPTAALAADGDVASVGNQNYTTLTDALTAVASSTDASTTVKLLAPVSGNFTISGGTFTLDLNGQTITAAKSTPALTISGGTVTISDSGSGSGTINAYGGESVCYGVEVTGGSFTMSGGTIKSLGEGGGYGVVANSGTTTISGGTIEATGNGVYINGDSGNPAVTISGGSITGGNFGVYGVYSDTDFTLSGGRITGGQADLLLYDEDVSINIGGVLNNTYTFGYYSELNITEGSHAVIAKPATGSSVTVDAADFVFMGDNYTGNAGKGFTPAPIW